MNCIDEYFKEFYQELVKKIYRLKKVAPISELKSDIKIMEKFLSKNVRLIMNKKVLKEYTGGVSVKTEEKDSLDDKYQELKLLDIQKSNLSNY